MKSACFFIVLLLPLTMGAKLFTDDLASRGLPDCDESAHLECKKVEVNFNSLSGSDDLELFDGIKLSRKTESQMPDGSTQLQLQNEALGIEATLHFGVQGDRKWISGSVNWDKEGRHFRLDELKDRSGFSWVEMNSKHWSKLSEGDGVLHIPLQERELNKDQLRLLDIGRADTTTPVTVTITVYTTPQFRASFSDVTSMNAFINQAVAESNTGYANSQVPINLSLRCVRDSSINDDPSLATVLQNFYNSAGGNFNNVRRSSDMALLMTNSGDACGIAYFDTISRGINLGVVQKDCATGYYSFGHEIAHMYGCTHNRETGATNPTYPTAFGFLMRPPVNSGYRTILAYPDNNYNNRVNWYSNPNVQYSGIPTGDVNDNNAQLLVERRFLMSAVGDETMACTDAVASVPLYRYFNGREHFYTENSAEIGTVTPGVRGRYGYQSEGTACSLLTAAGPGRAPLFRYWNGAEHFYTINVDEIGTTTPGATGKYSYVCEGIAGYCYTSQVAGSIPFHRYWNNYEHFYTTNVNEIGTTVPGAVGNYGYRYEGVACFVLP